VILPIVSIVVPAHDEETVVEDNLRALLAGSRPGEFEVVVVPNACSDRTAERAATVEGVRVVETDVPGKAHALELGDAACSVFPRLYLDADVRMDAESVRALVAASERPGVLACSPVPDLDLSGAGRVARRTHKVHDRMVAPGRVLAGTGAYLLTEKGHGRVFPLPDGLLSDDGWVHASFAPGERAAVAGARSTVAPARTVRAHLRRRVRVRLGNRQLAALGRPVTDRRLGLGDLRGLLRTRQVTPLDAACYLSVMVLDKALTRMRAGRPVDWGTDRGSRSHDGRETAAS
jgi:hypothetical protein